MTYVGRVRLSPGAHLSKLERLRRADELFDQLKSLFAQSEALWEQSSKSQDERLHACVGVVAALADFGVKAGVSGYASERLNDLLVALDELICGRRPALFTPSPVHAGKFSTTDLAQQAMAQVCVDYLRGAGAGAEEARKKVSALFDKHKLPKFSVAKLRLLNSRLKGPGSSQDQAYDMYVWAKAHAARRARQLNVDPTRSLQTAIRLSDTLIQLAKRRDHRRDFFFAPDEDSREVL